MKSESPKQKEKTYILPHANMIGSIQQIDGSDNISVSKLHLSKAVTCSYAR